MPTYRTIPPRAGPIHDEEYGSSSTAEVWIEAEPLARDTGILDVNGNPIYRMPEPIGFRLSRVR